MLAFANAIFQCFEIIALPGCGVEASVSFFASGGPISSRSGEEYSALGSAEYSFASRFRAAGHRAVSQVFSSGGPISFAVERNMAAGGIKEKN